jgi:hypothetical protein
MFCINTTIAQGDVVIFERKIHAKENYKSIEFLDERFLPSLLSFQIKRLSKYNPY